jgi:hypothetical protein
MPGQDWTEIVVFIHGITPNEHPEDKKHDPRTDYNTLFENIQKELKSWPNKPTLDPVPIKITWNWKPTDAPLVYKDQDLAEAERRVANMALELETKIRTVNIAHYILWKWFYKKLRDLIVYGFADAFYYVSRDGETTVRKHVFESLCDEIENRLNQQHFDGAPAKISLTIIAHSAGSLIAHDFLYHLFSQKKKNSLEAELVKVLQLRSKAVDNSVRLRIRRFYTFGSPIASWIFRANSLLKKIMNEQKLELDEIGLGAQPELSNPRWVNFWTLTDAAAFPLGFLYDNQDIVKDQYVDVGWWFPATHDAYWTSSKVAKCIAEIF